MEEAGGLDTLAAHDSLVDFARRRGEAALRLSLHAALPQVLHVDLVHALRLNFGAGGDAALVADVLFAPFCRPLGNDYFEFDRQARLLLLGRIDAENANESPRRTLALADFVLAWLDREQHRPRADTDGPYRSWLEVERWNALAFCDPDAAAEQLAVVLRMTIDDGAARARLRIGALASGLAVPLAVHYRLLAYAAGVAAAEGGDSSRAATLLDHAGDRPIVTGRVTLRPLPRQAVPAPDTAERPPAEVIYGVLLLFDHTDIDWARRLARQANETLADLDSGVDLVDDHWIGDERQAADAARRLVAGAQVALVLLSPRFLASPFFAAVEAELIASARAGRMRLLWTMTHKCDWATTPYAAYQCVNQPGEALADQAAGIGQLLVRNAADAMTLALRQVRAASAAAGPQSGGSIFIAYRHEDTHEAARRLRESLERHGLADRLFLDATDIPAGDRWEEVISSRLAKSRVMLVLVGRRGLSVEGWLNLEIQSALKRQLFVLPVLLDGVFGHDHPALSGRTIAPLRTPSWDADVGHIVDLVAPRLADAPLTPVRRVLLASTVDLGPEFEAACSLMHELGLGFSFIDVDVDVGVPSDRIVKELQSCDALVLIVGGRYGYVPAGSEQSLVELEYALARDASKQVLAFVKRKHTAAADSDRVTGDGSQGQLIERFRRRLANEVALQEFDSVTDLRGLLAAALGAASLPETLGQPRSAYACFAAEDRSQALDRIATLSVVERMDVFMDSLLSPGEQWQQRIEAEIRSRDVFLLFWSSHARKSKWVEWEWRAALKLKGLAAIRVLALEPASAAPPPVELSSLHFSFSPSSYERKPAIWKLFISHSSKDNPFVRELWQMLSNHGHEVWVDSRPAGGDPLVGEIQEAIKAASAYVIVVSTDALQSRWVGKELQYALKLRHERGKDHFPVIPLSLDGARLGELEKLFGEEPIYVPVSSGTGSVERAMDALLMALGNPYPATG